MGGVFFRMVSFTVGAGIVSYVVFLIASSIVNAQAAGINQPVLVRDEVQANKHELSGMVEVNSPCDELSLAPSSQVSATTYKLTFTTWREPSVTCDNNRTPREFHETIFAPAAGIYFIATLNDSALPLAVIPVISGQTDTQ